MYRLLLCKVHNSLNIKKTLWLPLPAPKPHLLHPTPLSGIRRMGWTSPPKRSSLTWNRIAIEMIKGYELHHISQGLPEKQKGGHTSNIWTVYARRKWSSQPQTHPIRSSSEESWTHVTRESTQISIVDGYHCTSKRPILCYPVLIMEAILNCAAYMIILNVYVRPAG